MKLGILTWAGQGDSDALSMALLALGATGIQIEDKAAFAEVVSDMEGLDAIADAYLSDLSDEVKLEAYFPLIQGEEGLCFELIKGDQGGFLYPQEERSRKPFETGLQEIQAEIQRSLCEQGISGWSFQSYRIEDEQDWVAEFEKDNQPRRIGGHVTVVPTRLRNAYQAEPDELVLWMDPGSAFGTGDHQTTALCVQAIESLFQVHPEWKEEPCLDLGCGTGILAFSMMLHGARSLLACDIDPHAVDVCRYVAAQNGFSLETVAGTLDDLTDEGRPRQFAFIAANLIDALHVRLATAYVQHLLPQGRILLSGIVAEHAEPVREAMRQSGLRQEAEFQADEWIAQIWFLPASET